MNACSRPFHACSLIFRDRSLHAGNVSGGGNKLFGCGLGAINLDIKRAAQVGMGMVPRGEVGIIVAQIALSLAVIGPELYVSYSSCRGNHTDCTAVSENTL